MRRVILIAALAAVSFVANAQTSQSVFFLEKDPSIYRLNAALGDTLDFVGAGGVDYASRGNVGLSSFVYPNPNGEGGIVTGLHSGISSAEFLGNLKESNFRNSSAQINLFSYGKMSKGAFHTLEANIKGNFYWTMPKEVFQVLKVGSNDTDYDLSGFDVNANLYAELAYGYKRKLNNWLTVGGRAKLLAGFTNANYSIEQLDVRMAEDAYTMTAKAKLKAATPLGLGAAIDLGAVLTPIKGLEVSLGVNNIGAIRWKFTKVGESSGTATYNGFDKYNVMPDDLKELNNTVSDVLSDVKKSFKLNDGEASNEFKAVPISANAGIKYRLPFYDKVSVGAIGHYEKGVYDHYIEGRAGAGIDVFGWLNFAANAGICSYNTLYGISTSIRIKQFRVNFSTEGPFSKYIPTHRRFMPVIPIPLEAYSNCTSISLVYML